MQNAFVAVADDATAALWNPAGLVQLERPEISFVGSFNAIQEFFSSTGHPEFDSSHSDTNFDVNFMGLVYPLPFTLGGRNLSLSLTYHQRYDLSRRFDVDFDSQTQLQNGGMLLSERDFLFKQEGSLGSLTLSGAMELTQTLSVGFGANFWRDNPINQNGWKQTMLREQDVSLNGGQPNSSTRTTVERYSNVTGESFNIGVLWSATDRLNLGLRYETALDANADYSLHETSTDIPDLTVNERRRLHIPPTLVFGAAFRVNDKLTLAGDVSTTDWDNFYVQRADGSRFSLVDASDLDDGIDFERTWTVRLGAEYLFLPDPEKLGERLDYLWSLRGGLLFDQEPASGRSTSDPLAAPTGKPDNFFGASIGVGFLAFQRVNFDLAYQFRFGLGVNSDYIRGVPGFEENVFQHRILFSTIIYF